MPAFLPEIRQRTSAQPDWMMIFGRKMAFSHGISLATDVGMSPIARVLHERFEEICRAELVRLRKKKASLSPADQAELDIISLSVARAIAARLGEAVDRDTATDTGSILTHLFAVTPDDD